MKIKQGVALTGLRPEMIIGLLAIQEIFRKYGEEVVVTSAVEGRHSPTSLHYTGCALDIRTRNLPPQDVTTLTAELKADLGIHFDVIAEPSHLHIEFQPRRHGS